MKKLTKKEVHSILKNCYGWGDAKRKLCAVLEIQYDWHVVLPEYMMKYIKEYYSVNK